MSNLNLIENKEVRIKENIRFNWQDSLPIQRLLDVISSILAEEYILIAKQNSRVFLNPGETKCKQQFMQDTLLRIRVKSPLMTK